MDSTRPTLARPVRMPRICSVKRVTLFSIRSSASNTISSMLIIESPSRNGEQGSRDRFGPRGVADPGSDGLAIDGPFDVPLFLEIEHQDRQLVFEAHTDGRHVHDLELVAHH